MHLGAAAAWPASAGALRAIFAMLALVALCLPGATAAQNFPALTGRVVDAADLLSPQQEAELTQRLEALEQASSRQLVVATVPDLQGYPIDDYGYQLGRHWGIGQEGANNGVLLVVAPNERRVRIEVGYGLEPIVTDALSYQIINREILPRFRAGDMADGIIAGANALIQQLQAPPEQAEQAALAAAEERQRGGGGSIFPLIFWSVVIVIIIAAMARSGRRGTRYRGRRRRRGAPIIIWGSGGGWSGGSSGWGGGGFGGFGGGGGGFGGFGGGGGSFGGGGASGGW